MAMDISTVAPVDFFKDITLAMKSIVITGDFDIVAFVMDVKFQSIELADCIGTFLPVVQKAYGKEAAEYILKAVIVACAFGVNVTRTDRMSEGLKTFINDFTAKTKIIRGKGVEKSNVMTWQRLQLAFPFVRGVLTELGMISAVGNVPADLPVFYCGPGGASMVSDELWRDAAFQANYKKWLISFAKQINRVNDHYKGKTDDDIAADQMNFAGLQQSNGFSEKARPGWWSAAASFRINLLKPRVADTIKADWIAMVTTNTVIAKSNFNMEKLGKFYEDYKKKIGA
jgi:hypothetical protein